MFTAHRIYKPIKTVNHVVEIEITINFTSLVYFWGLFQKHVVGTKNYIYVFIVYVFDKCNIHLKTGGFFS